MDKETLSNYGWIVVLVLVLAVMLALATPFGTFIAGAIKSTTAGLFNVNQAALGSAGIDVNDMVFENCDHLETEIRNVTDTYTGDTCCKNCGKVISTGQTVRPKVPEGGQYTAADGTVYNPGDEFPETITTGDRYTIGHYEYKYNNYMRSGSNWSEDTSQNGWGVRSYNKSGVPDPILETVNGEPVTNMNYAFNGKGITSAPAIHSNIKDMSYAFYSCASLKTAPDMSNAINVTNMSMTFTYCTSLTTVPNLANCSKLTNMSGTFGRCSSLTDVSNVNIPNSVTNLQSTFNNCTSLTDDGMPIIPSSVTSLKNTFLGCTSLIDLDNFIISSNITSLDSTFKDCTGLVIAPDFTQATSLTMAIYTFQGCTSLIEAPYLLNCANLGGIGAMFSGCTSLTVAPAIPNKITNLYGNFENCTALRDVSQLIIPSGTVSLNTTFKNCTSLTGTITINGEPHNSSYYEGCFAGVDFETQNITLSGTSTYLDTFGATGTNYCAECNGKCNGGH